MASCSQIWAGAHHFVFLKYLFPTVLHSRGRMRSSTRKEGSGRAGGGGIAGGLGTSHGCSPDTRRPPARSGPQSCSHQLPGICHCHFPSVLHCSGNRMRRAELLATLLDKGAECRGGSKPNRGLMCPMMGPGKSHK